ncbi:MAG TPA: PspC domain-containing protein [Steroidobacteraceae bacterium]|jgi:phage shock protein PspC (stress-responsive transcriptional regulator)
MNTVIIINLNGNAFHVEEPGYQSLRAYLERAQTQLKDNPDRTEIMADLEQAIADKGAHFLRPHKNVLSAAEIDDVLRQMGPVQTDGEQPSPSSAANEQPRAQAADRDTTAPKRLYQIREGAMLSGVCTGIAAYFNIDVTIVRILFVLMTLLTGGIWILAYIVMMLVIPFANTDEEHAAAAGAPFNAQEVIDRAKKHYGEFKDSKEWRRHWRQQRREWRRKWRDGAYWWGQNLQRNVYQVSAHTSGYGGHIAVGVLIPILAVISVLLFCVWIVAIVSLATTGTIFGVAMAGSMPLWASILILIILYSVIARPLRHLRRALYYNRDGYNHVWFTAWYELMSTGFLILVAWLAYTHLPQVHDFFQHFVQNVTTIINNILDSLRPSSQPKPTILGFYARLSGATAAGAASAFLALRG